MQRYNEGRDLGVGLRDGTGGALGTVVGVLAGGKFSSSTDKGRRVAAMPMRDPRWGVGPVRASHAGVGKSAKRKRSGMTGQAYGCLQPAKDHRE